jgi:hypothetical protein
MRADHPSTAKMSGSSDSFLAVWKRDCWKCHEQITVVMDLTEWRGPHATHGGMWKQHVSPEEAVEAKGLVKGVNIKFRESSDVPEGYYANVCARCDSVQGDWFLNEDLTRFTYEEVPKDFYVLQLRGGESVKTFHSVPELERYRFGGAR